MMKKTHLALAVAVVAAVGASLFNSASADYKFVCDGAPVMEIKQVCDPSMGENFCSADLSSSNPVSVHSELNAWNKEIGEVRAQEGSEGADSETIEVNSRM